MEHFLLIMAISAKLTMTYDKIAISIIDNGICSCQSAILHVTPELGNTMTSLHVKEVLQ